MDRSMKIASGILPICVFVLFACAPARIKIYPRETPPQKTAPEKGASENLSPEKTTVTKGDPEKISPVETTPEKTASLKPSPQKPSPEKIPQVKPPLAKTYSETVSGWKSHHDLVKWMENVFSVDLERYKHFEGTLPLPRTPEKTFELKLGIYIDAVIFLKETLNRIHPSYQAQVVVLFVRPYRFNHYVCSFRKDGKIFIMDYGTPFREVTGVHGPYHTLEEYKKFYERHHPLKKMI